LILGQLDGMLFLHAFMQANIKTLLSWTALCLLAFQTRIIQVAYSALSLETLFASLKQRFNNFVNDQNLAWRSALNGVAFNNAALGKSLLTSGQVIGLSATSWLLLSIAANAMAIQWAVPNEALSAKSIAPLAEVLDQVDALPNQQPAQSLLGTPNVLQRFPVASAETKGKQHLGAFSLRVNMGTTDLANYIPVETGSFKQSTLTVDEPGKPVGFFASLIKDVFVRHPKKQPHQFKLGVPLSHYGLTSRFGMRNGRPHRGVDLSGTVGSKVLAAENGVVVLVHYYGGYGNLIIVDHGNGYSTRYAHLDKMLPKLGTRVRKGQTIGTIGMTGRTTGPHLHFEVLRRRNQVDPMLYLKNDMA